MRLAAEKLVIVGNLKGEIDDEDDDCGRDSGIRNAEYSAMLEGQPNV
jgi:hypothetical protein